MARRTNTTTGNSNGGHLRLALMILGVIVGLLVPVCTWARVSFTGQDARLRTVEQKAAATEERYKAIAKSLDEIKTDLKDLRKRE